MIYKVQIFLILIDENTCWKKIFARWLRHWKLIRPPRGSQLPHVIIIKQFMHFMPRLRINRRKSETKVGKVTVERKKNEWRRVQMREVFCSNYTYPEEFRTVEWAYRSAGFLRVSINPWIVVAFNYRDPSLVGRLLFESRRWPRNFCNQSNVNTVGSTIISITPAN